MGCAGRYRETEVFSLSPGDAGLLAFERSFPPKERVEGTPSQRRFARSAARLCPNIQTGVWKPFYLWWEYRAYFLSILHVHVTR